MDTAGADIRTGLLFARRLMKGSAALLLLTIEADTWKACSVTLLMNSMCKSTDKMSTVN